MGIIKVVGAGRITLGAWCYFFLKSFNEFLQGREVTSLVIDHGTLACTRCGVMETQDSETAGWVSSLIFLFIKEKKTKIIRC